MATVTGLLLRVAGDELTLAAGADVLALRARGEALPASLGPGDEVAGWREGPYVRELRLARIRTDAGIAGDGTAPGTIRLDTGTRLWDLRAWPGVADSPGHLRVCHDGFLVLWALGGDGEVRLPPPPAPAGRGSRADPWRKLRASI